MSPSDTPPSYPAGHTADPVVRQRRRLVGVVAAIAASVGAGVSWRTHRAPDAGSARGDGAGEAASGRSASAATAPTSSSTSQSASPSPSPSASAPAAAPDRLATIDGRVLTPADWRGRPLVLNFWAPWCGPCVKEMPELDRFHRAQAGSAKGAVVIGLAIDDEPAVRQFLQAHPVSFPIAVLGFAGLSQARAMSGQANVALPFTAVFGIDGTLSHRKFGPTDTAELGRWARGEP